jgi:hypothetical protein
MRKCKNMLPMPMRHALHVHSHWCAAPHVNLSRKHITVLARVCKVRL